MGDRTDVTITLRKGDFEKVKEELVEETRNEEIVEDGGIVTITGTEINYGEWPQIEDTLQKNEIEYDRWWGRGGDYDSGTAYYRKVKGKYKSFEIYEGEELVSQCLNRLLEESKKDPKKLITVINKEIKKIRPWEPRNLDEPNSVRFIKDDK